MRNPLLLLPTLALAAGCAASTYPLNPQLAAQVGLDEQGVSFTERVGRNPDGSSAILQQGACSWYGPGFHGRRTSSGEVFDENALTAAHPTLPFGSEVEVTNLQSGKTVRVRINDRGPFAHERILDLSYAAAASIELVGRGVGDVRLRLVDVDQAEWGGNVFALQVASFPSKIDAERFVDGLSASQRSAGLYYVKQPDGGKGSYDVRFGPFPCEKSAKSVADRLRRSGLQPAVTREDLTRSSSAANSATTATN